MLKPKVVRNVRKVNEENRVDWLCLCSPDWDIRFTRCPLRSDHSIARCRILSRAINLLPPKYCCVERHNGATVLREIGAHLHNTEPENLSDGVSNEKKQGRNENIFN